MNKVIQFEGYSYPFIAIPVKFPGKSGAVVHRAYICTAQKLLKCFPEPAPGAIKGGINKKSR